MPCFVSLVYLIVVIDKNMRFDSLNTLGGIVMFRGLFFSVLISLSASIGVACDDAQANKAYDEFSDIFMAMTGATYLVLSYGDEDGSAPTVSVEMANQEEIDKVKAVYRDGLIFRGCEISFVEDSLDDTKNIRRITSK